jgi:hypothetical protein
MALKWNFKTLFQIQFPKLRNWIASIVTAMRDTTCIASSLKLVQVIRKWRGGGAVTYTE